MIDFFIKKKKFNSIQDSCDIGSDGLIALSCHCSGLFF